MHWMMRHVRLLGVSASVLLLGTLTLGTALGTTAAAAPATAVFVASATLSGREEVPPVLDTRAGGVALYQLSPDGAALEYTLVAWELTTPPVMAHIHAPAPRGQNAPVVARLFPPNPRSSCSSASALLLRCTGRITAADLEGPLAGRPLGALIELMAAGQSYTNVHTTRHPDGEIRGQNEPLVRVGLP
jgi:CHRD domain